MIMPSTPPSSPRIDVMDSLVTTDSTSSTQSGDDRDFAKVVSSHLNLNLSQQDAVVLGSCLTTQGFSLVQGPPGTGKTTTLIGIVNAIHLTIYAKFYSSLIEAALGRAGQQCRQQITATADPISAWIALYSDVLAAKHRMLLVAPSNIAVDNIVARIVERGFIDGSGNIYKPSIVRIGVGKSSSAASSASMTTVVSLEETVDREIMSSLSTAEGKSMIDKMLHAMHATAEELFAAHSYLLTLRDAFKLHPLPPGYELRVDLGSGLPYWVDHVARSTSFKPPIIAADMTLRDFGGNVVHYSSIRMLPEYVIHTKALTRLLNELYKGHLTLTRLRARLQGTRTDGNNNSSSGALGRGSLMKESRAAIESSILESCDIICSTLNSAGHASLAGMRFQVCVVDEAAQATEPSLLIPLNLGCTHCVLIGDCNQLPATVLSQVNRNSGFDVSLFERLLRARHPFILLNEQYRMHPLISRFPSLTFYDGRVLDAPSVSSPQFGLSVFQQSLHTPAAVPCAPPLDDSFASPQTPLLRPSMFFNVAQSQDTKQSMSLLNIAEAHIVVQLVQELIREVQLHGCWQWGTTAGGEQVCFAETLTVGIISPYADQVAQVRKLMRQANLPSTLRFNNRANQDRSSSSSSTVSVPFEYDVNTVDGFQGKEKDVIIFSCVRANEAGSIGFLSDFRRLNVALTRARFGLFVVGHTKTLISNPMWRGFIEYTKVLTESA
jgi:senataxin